MVWESAHQQGHWLQPCEQKPRAWSVIGTTAFGLNTQSSSRWGFTKGYLSCPWPHCPIVPWERYEMREVPMTVEEGVGVELCDMMFRFIDTEWRPMTYNDDVLQNILKKMYYEHVLVSQICWIFLALPFFVSRTTFLFFWQATQFNEPPKMIDVKAHRYAWNYADTWGFMALYEDCGWGCR